MKNRPTFILSLVLMPAVAIGALFYIPGPGGQPLMNMAKLKRTLGGEWTALFRKAEGMVSEVGETASAVGKKASQYVTTYKRTEVFDPSFEPPPETLFKWRDKEGNWHFSNQVPPESVAFEVVDQ